MKEGDLDEIRRDLTRLANEVEKLKGGEVKKVPEALQGMPEHLDTYFDALEKQLIEPNAGMAYYGGIQKKDGKVVSSYHSGNDIKSILKCSPKRVERLLSPFSNEQRIIILKTLIEGNRGSSELTKATGLEGGQLYHHLKELALAEFIEQEQRGVYALTEKGRHTLLTALAMAMTLEKRAIPEEIEATFSETVKE
jgi:DNA-binding HxlR family transcriptional regulator